MKLNFGTDSILEEKEFLLFKRALFSLRALFFDM